VSRAVLGGTLDPDEALERIPRIAVSPLGHPPDLAPWCFLWEGLHPDDYRTLESGQREAEARCLVMAWSTCPPEGTTSALPGVLALEPRAPPTSERQIGAV
jgi:hypothetical protein